MLSVRALIEEGNKLLPNLTSVGHTATPVGSTHDTVDIVESEFRFCNLPSLTLDPSSLLSLGTYKGKAIEVYYHNEAGI